MGDSKAFTDRVRSMIDRACVLRSEARDTIMDLQQMLTPPCLNEVASHIGLWGVGTVFLPNTTSLLPNWVLAPKWR